MSYDEPRFISRRNEGPIQVLVATNTHTASGLVMTATPAVRAGTVRGAILTGARACVLTAGVSASPTVSVALGGTVALSFSISHTAGAIGGTVSLTNTTTGTAGEIPTVTIVCTGTASATQITPVLELIYEFREQFS